MIAIAAQNILICVVRAGAELLHTDMSQESYYKNSHWSDLTRYGVHCMCNKFDKKTLKFTKFIVEGNKNRT
jgi:nitrous oxidase accessory protein NosD